VLEANRYSLTWSGITVRCFTLTDEFCKPSMEECKRLSKAQGRLARFLLSIHVIKDKIKDKHKSVKICT
jgi:hypothetical protein